MRYRFLRFPGGKDKAVTLSYDDGGIEDLHLSEILNKYGIKCTFNLNCRGMRNANLSDSEIKEFFLEKGHEIAIHGAGHRAEGAMRPIEGIRDVLECRLELEKRFGIIIRGMAYPDTGITVFSNSASYDKIKQYLRELDVAYARTLGGDNNAFLLPTDWYAWVPTAQHTNPKLMEYAEEFVNLDLSVNTYCAQRMPRLFYLWGHGFEFEIDNNWDLLECFCNKVARQDNIWYATNIEIYEYVNAYNSLIYSSDGTIIYNPTLYELWFDIDGEIYKISSGETIRI